MYIVYLDNMYCAEGVNFEIINFLLYFVNVNQKTVKHNIGSSELKLKSKLHF